MKEKIKITIELSKDELKVLQTILDKLEEAKDELESKDGYIIDFDIKPKSKLTRMYLLIKKLQEYFKDGVPLEVLFPLAVIDGFEIGDVINTIERLLGEGEIYESRPKQYKAI